ncbi:MAG TPA: hypothetical protein DDZ80_27615 [Cyanobacteria bacterium UBA8803]|nr:hypothetical protein [Cyanobacteria bacterium UBA9273]HBL62038.1 hypothetical protein [Cyanobacteria bacterium UBA8803]
MTEETFDQQITLSLRRVEALWQRAHELLEVPNDESQPGQGVPAQPQKLLMESLTELSHSLQELQFAAGELRQQNEKLAESRMAVEAERQRYKELFNFAPDGYLVTNPEAEVAEANQAAAQLLNFSPEGLVGKSLVAFVATQERRDFYYKLSQLQRGESINNWPVQIQPRGGSSFLASFTVVPVQDTQGQVVGLRWRLQDLAAVRYRESSQPPSKHLFCAVLDRAAIGIALLDSEGRVIDRNQTLQDMLGCDGEILQAIFPQLMNWDKPGVESAMFHQLLTGERRSYQLEKRLFHPERSIEWVRLTLALVPAMEEEPIYITCILEDITEQKQLKAEQQEAIKQQQAIKQEQEAIKQLAASQQEQPPASNQQLEQPGPSVEALVEQLGKLLNTILSSSSDFFFVSDRAGKYIYVNQTAAKAWGLAQSDFIGKTWQQLQLSAEVTERLEVQRETVLKMGLSINDETSLTTAEGIRDYEYTMTRLNDINGEGGAVAITFKDITEQKQAVTSASEALAKEAELMALKSYLAHFASVVTQELRSPLNNIFSYAKRIENNHQQGNGETNTNYPQRIQVNARRINQLLNDLVLLKKIEAKELHVNPTWLDLNDFCHKLSVELQHHGSGQHRIAFTSQGHCFGLWDEKLLRRTLMNLLLNAMQYSPEGSEIQFELVCEEEKVMFHIQDCGIGIPEDDRKFLFNGFHRGSNVGAIAGNGLGLLVVKQCVQLQGGKIDLESQVGVGTRVTVTLPFDHHPAESPAISG